MEAINIESSIVLLIKAHQKRMFSGLGKAVLSDQHYYAILKIKEHLFWHR
jgi:hypothetical protein